MRVERRSKIAQEGKKQLSSVENYIRENPFQSVLIGAGFGALFFVSSKTNLFKLILFTIGFLC